MSELDKLELYLITAGYKHYERIDEEHLFVSRHQIIIYDENGERLWDAICHRGSYGYENGLFWDAICHRDSYGYENGLLEIYGNIVDKKKDGDEVVGWLTADDVIKRIERNN